MPNNSNSGYFQFPLCLLAFSTDYKIGLQYIVSYCLCERALRLDPTCPKLSGSNALYKAAKFLHVEVASDNATIQEWETANAFIDRWEARHGRDASVRIATALLWEAYDNTGITHREFSILCAINSIIGKGRRSPRRITEPSIRVRAAGFKSWTVANRELSPDELLTRLLTPYQVRYTLEKLHQRKSFARARVGAKTVKYMIGVTDRELRALLLQTETYHSRFKAERAQKGRELMIAIRSANQAPAHNTVPPESNDPIRSFDHHRST